MEMMRKTSLRFLIAVSALAFLSASVLAKASSVSARGYANPSMLARTDWLARHLSDSDLRIVDMRRKSEYEKGHVPGAVRIPESPLRNPEDRFAYLPRPAVFAAMMRNAGIGDRTTVVAYDDQGGKMAARLWYVLSAFGHPRARLLDGGWLKWSAEKRLVSTEIPAVKPTKFVVKSVPTLSCPSPELLKRPSETLVLDARSPEEYRGETISPGAKKAGRIPGAVNVEWKENVTGPCHVFKSANALRRLYAAKGITPDKSIVVHCASGGRASQTLFALKLLGYPKIRIYYGSFDDYASRPDAPVAK